MPYAFAHPAAVIPVASLLGRRAVPSALAIGSMIPDAWYLVPSLTRAHSHDALGLLWFCLPAGLFAYVAFHLIFKQPMLALLPRTLAGRLGAWTSPGLPQAPWSGVLISLVAGIATHLAWDAFTHEGPISEAFPFLEADLLALGGFKLRALQLLQHASTLLGTVFLGGWLWRKLRATTPRRDMGALHPRVRWTVLAAMLLVPGIAFVGVLSAFDAGAFRTALRAGGVTAVSTLGFVALCFCLAWSRYRRQLQDPSCTGGHGTLP